MKTKNLFYDGCYLSDFFPFRYVEMYENIIKTSITYEKIKNHHNPLNNKFLDMWLIGPLNKGR